jgi:hypothetical protein
MTSAAVMEQPWATAAEVVRLVERFEDCTLPHGEWTHRAHLTVALWYATRHEPGEALDRVRAGLLRLNAAHGVPTTPTRGYHETITRFWMHTVARHVAREGRAGDWADRANRLVAMWGSRELPLRHYSQARLMSPEARAGWVEPDLEPLGG